ncbi:MAG TPA: hypothetical protein GXX46_10895 [Peptococcaceae bacterium]|nr:hypothetical protein [Peptococcaceae bacterium]
MPENSFKLENVQFSKSLWGYNVQEVNSYINELLSYCQSLSNEIKTLEKKLSYYEKQEQCLASTLVIAEQAATAIKNNANEKAKSIEALAEKKATELLKKAESEAKMYRDNIYNSFYTYEKQLRLVIDRFYALARNHMESLEKEFVEEVRTAISKLDKEFNVQPRLKLVSNTKQEESKSNILLKNLKERETAALLGRILKKDIKNSEGHLIAKKNTVITPDLLNSLIGKGLYGELIAAAEQ